MANKKRNRKLSPIEQAVKAMVDMHIISEEFKRTKSESKKQALREEMQIILEGIPALQNQLRTMPPANSKKK